MLQIEVLGVSLPWARMSTDCGISDQYIKLSQQNSVHNNDFQNDLDLNASTNPFLENSNYHSLSSSGDILPTQQSTTDNLIDLLTGELILSPEPENSNVLESKFNNVDNLHIFGNDDSGNLHRTSSVSGFKDEAVKELGHVQHYKDLSITLLRSGKVSLLIYPS